MFSADISLAQRRRNPDPCVVRLSRFGVHMQSRRLFLQELATAATALALDPLRGVTALAQVYE
jgi:hypothetical protein